MNTKSTRWKARCTKSAVLAAVGALLIASTTPAAAQGAAIGDLHENSTIQVGALVSDEEIVSIDSSQNSPAPATTHGQSGIEDVTREGDSVSDEPVFSDGAQKVQSVDKSLSADPTDEQAGNPTTELGPETSDAESLATEEHRPATAPVGAVKAFENGAALVVTEVNAHGKGASFANALDEALIRGGSQEIIITAGLDVQFTQKPDFTSRIGLTDLKISTDAQNPGRLTGKIGATIALSLGDDEQPTNLILENLVIKEIERTTLQVKLSEKASLDLRKVEFDAAHHALFRGFSKLKLTDVVAKQTELDFNASASHEAPSAVVLERVTIVESWFDLSQGGKGSTLDVDELEISNGSSDNYWIMFAYGDQNEFSNVSAPAAGAGEGNLNLDISGFRDLVLRNSAFEAKNFSGYFSAGNTKDESQSPEVLLEDVLVRGVKAYSKQPIQFAAGADATIVLRRVTYENNAFQEALNFERFEGQWIIEDSSFINNVSWDRAVVLTSRDSSNGRISESYFSGNHGTNLLADVVVNRDFGKEDRHLLIENTTFDRIENQERASAVAISTFASTGASARTRQFTGQFNADLRNVTIAMEPGSAPAVLVEDEALSTTLSLDHVTMSGGGVNVSENAGDVELDIQRSVVDAQGEALEMPAQVALTEGDNFVVSRGALSRASEVTANDLALSSLAPNTVNGLPVLMPSVDSVLIESANTAGDLVTDARGVHRIQGKKADAGSIEYRVPQVGLVESVTVVEGEIVELPLTIENLTNIEDPADELGVKVASSDGTALSDQDYVEVAQELKGASLTTAKPVTVETASREGQQGDRTFLVSLEGARGVAYGPVEAVEVTIVDAPEDIPADDKDDNDDGEETPGPVEPNPVESGKPDVDTGVTDLPTSGGGGINSGVLGETSTPSPSVTTTVTDTIVTTSKQSGSGVLARTGFEGLSIWAAGGAVLVVGAILRRYSRKVS